MRKLENFFSIFARCSHNMKKGLTSGIQKFINDSESMALVTRKEKRVILITENYRISLVLKKYFL